MNEDIKQAVIKLESEFKDCEKKLDRYGKVIGKPIKEALISFCNQNSEFSRAVVRSTRTIGDCIKSVVSGNPGSLSDIEAYRRAVKFYFLTATVNFSMTIDLGDGGFSNDGVPEAKPSVKRLELSLDDLFG